LFGEGGQRVEFALGSGAGGEGAECVHGGGRNAL
jgi:cold shock CspA family protein